jgi:hypothetical protein
MRKFCLHVAAWMVTRGVMEIPMVFRVGPGVTAGRPSKYKPGTALKREGDGSVVPQHEAKLRALVKSASKGALAANPGASCRTPRSGSSGGGQHARIFTSPVSKKAQKRRRQAKGAQPLSAPGSPAKKFGRGSAARRNAKKGGAESPSSCGSNPTEEEEQEDGEQNPPCRETDWADRSPAVKTQSQEMCWPLTVAEDFFIDSVKENLERGSSDDVLGQCLHSCYYSNSSIPAAGKGLFANKDLEVGDVVAVLSSGRCRQLKDHQNKAMHVEIADGIYQRYHDPQFIVDKVRESVDVDDDTSAMWMCWGGCLCNEARTLEERNAVIVAIKVRKGSRQLSKQMTVLIVCKEMKIGDEVLTDYGQGAGWPHRLGAQGGVGR